MTLRIGVWTFGSQFSHLLRWARMDKEDICLHSPQIERAVSLKFVSGYVFGHLISLSHLLAGIDAKLSLRCMTMPVPIPPSWPPLPSLLHEAPAATAIMTGHFSPAEWAFSPLRTSAPALLLPRVSLTCLLWVATSHLPFEGSLSVPFPRLFPALSCSPEQPRDWVNHTALTGYVLTELVIGRESHSSWYP